MQYVADALEDPTDVVALRKIYPWVDCSELIADMSLGDDEALMAVMRTRTWKKLVLFNPPVSSIPWFGQHLTHLDIRSDEPVNLFFCTMLPELVDLRVAATRFSGGIRSVVPKLKHLRLVSCSMFGLFSDTREVFPELETMSIHMTILHATSGMSFPRKLRTLYLSGMLMTHVVDALKTCDATDVSLVCGGLLDVPELSPDLTRLDLSHNLIGRYGSDRFPLLKELILQDNFMFDSTTISGRAIQYLDIRGTHGWPFDLPNVHTIMCDVDPPLPHILMYPKLRRVVVRCVDTIVHTWHIHASLVTIAPGAAEEEDVPMPLEWHSYVDDVQIAYQYTQYDASIGENV